jgi:hypothetical protein
MITAPEQEGAMTTSVSMTAIRPGRVIRAAILMAPFVIAGIVGCSSATEENTSPETTTTEPSPTSVPDEDLVMEAGDFVRLDEMTPVRGFFVDNPLGYLDEALEVANNPDGGLYPVGTVIQLIPQEAMVKRAPGFDPDTNDWEFFELEVDAADTSIRVRGGSDVVNQFGASCAGCHSQAEPQFDFVCEKDNGCDPLPEVFSDEVIRSVQEADPRPAREQ